MNKLTFVKILAFLIFSAGLAVMAGWLFDIAALKSLGSAWVNMKFSTAFSFVVSGVSLYFLARAREGDLDATQVALSITSFVLILLMGLIFFSSVFNIRTGVEELVVKDPGGVKSVVPGRPSLPTTICFLLIGLAGILTLVNAHNVRMLLRVIGFAVFGTGLLAVFGYILDAPMLYYYIDGKNSAIAIHTAGLFLTLGTGLLCL